MTRALLLTTDGKCESVTLPEHVEEYDAMCKIIGVKDFYQGVLASDSETDRTIFIFMDVYNDFHSGPQPPLNQFVAQHSKAAIYGDILLYISEPLDDGGDGEIMYDLDLSVPQLEILMQAVELRDGCLTPHILFEVLDNEVSLKKLEEILKSVGIHNYSD